MSRLLRVVLLTSSLSTAFHGVPAQSRGAVPGIIVAPNVKVSQSYDSLTHSEVIICADPDDPNRLLGVSHVHRHGRPKGNGIFIAAYGSNDGGKSWSLAADTRQFKNGAGDPSCAFGRDGTVYFTGL